jgi:hypothetical protein
MLVLAAILCVAAASSASASPWVIGRPHLLFDQDGLANVSDTLFTRLGTPTKDRSWTAVVPDRPWDAAVQFYTALVRLPDGFASGAGSGVRYHLYYPCSEGSLATSDIYACLSVSLDGETFSKPDLDVFPYTLANGSTVPTNRVLQTGFADKAPTPHCQIGNVLITSRPGQLPGVGEQARETDSASDAAFTMVVLYEAQVTDRWQLAAVSSDGVHFETSPNASLVRNLPSYFADSQSAVLEMDADVGPINSTSGVRVGGDFVAYGRLDTFTGPGCADSTGTFRRSQTASSAAANASDARALGPYGPASQSLVTLWGLDPGSCLDVYNPAPLQVPGGVLAMPSMFWHFTHSQSRVPGAGAGNDGVMDIRLLTSRDARNFTPVSRQPFLSRGAGHYDPNSGVFNGTGSDRDAGFIFLTLGGLIDPSAAAQETNTLPERPPGQRMWQLEDSGVADTLSAHVYLLHWASQTTHDGGGFLLYAQSPMAFTGIVRARLRREGFASLSTKRDVDAQSGSATTTARQLPVPATACGSANASLQLRLNYAAEVGGNVTVAVLDSSGRALPGFSSADSTPLRGNEVRGVASWGTPPMSDLSSLAGQDVALHVTLSNAQLYAWVLVCGAGGQV